MKKTIATSGLVLNAYPNGEHHKTLTLLTPEKGVVTVYAHGVQSKKNKSFAASNPLVFGDFELYCKNEGYVLKSATCHKSFFDNRFTLAEFAAISYYREVLEFICCRDKNETEMLRLALNIFHATKERMREAAIVKAVFELRCALNLGFAPDLSSCPHCEGFPTHFDCQNGCGVCREHIDPNLKSAGLIIPMSESCQRAISFIMTCPLKKILSFTIDHNGAHQLSKIAEKYLTIQLEHKFKSLPFLHQCLEREKETPASGRGQMKCR